MTNHLDDNDPQVIYAEWKNQSDTVSNTLRDFEFWVENDWVRDGKDPEEPEKLVKFLVDKYLHEDKKSLEIIQKMEQDKLKKWKG